MDDKTREAVDTSHHIAENNESRGVGKGQKDKPYSIEAPANLKGQLSASQIPHNAVHYQAYESHILSSCLHR